jgi:4-oxalocrotonate tautomerase
MPLIEVTLVEGRSAEQLRSLISGLTRAAVEAVDAPVDSIRVVIREVPSTHWAAGDVTIAERRANRPGADRAPPTPQGT